MGKLTGSLLILGGCGGCLWSWWKGQRKRQAVLMEFIRLFARWEYSLKRERLRLREFLEGYDCGRPEVQKFLDDLLGALKTFQYPAGAVLWREVLKENRAALGLTGEAWETLLSADKAFFGTSSQEGLRSAKAAGKRLEECLEKERAEFVKKQKVYLPVGMLAGVLLILLLI